MIKVLALDPATHCGWAHSCGPSGVWDLSVRKDESAGMRLVRLRAKLNEVKESLGVDLLVYESFVNTRFGRATLVAGQIRGTIEVWCLDNGVEYRAYSPNEIKVHATGKAKADKDLMVVRAKIEFKGVDIIDDNHADALWLLRLAKEDLGL